MRSTQIAQFRVPGSDPAVAAITLVLGQFIEQAVKWNMGVQFTGAAQGLTQADCS